MSTVTSSLGKKFVLTLKNASGAAVVIAILAGIFDTQKVVANTTNGACTITYSDATALSNAGFSIDAVANDGTIMTGVTCSSGNSKRTVKQFRDYIQRQGLVVKKLIISANNPDVFSQDIEITKYTPLLGSAPENLDLNTFYDQYQNQTSKIEIDFTKENAGLTLDFSTVMSMKIEDDRDVTLQFIF